MADYDVGVLSLLTPAAQAPLAQIRPVVSVRNNGLHDAVSSGYIRIYSAGLLVFESEAWSDTLAPGESGPASAVDYWTPPAEGFYVVNGYFSTPLDQVEPNNNLHPVPIEITGLPPPPPTPVPFHASQHESGGQDELSIEGLPGRAADPQDSLAHVATHQAGGSDALNVGGLQGELATTQAPKAHGNAAHSPQMATAEQLAIHNAAAAVHSAALNLEQTANKGQPDGYASLNSVGHVPDAQLAEVPEPPPDAGDALTFGSGWSPANALPHAYKHETGGDDEINLAGLLGGIGMSSHISDAVVVTLGPAVQVLRLDLTPAQIKNGVVLSADLVGSILTDASPSHDALFLLRFHSQAFTENIAIATLPCGPSCEHLFSCHIAGGIRQPLNRYAHGLVTVHARVNPVTPAALLLSVAANPAGGVIIQDLSNFYFEVLLSWSPGGAGDSIHLDTAAGHCIIP